MVLSYPEFLWEASAGSQMQRKLVCRTFSDCTTAPRNGLPSGCYPLDEHYKNSELARKTERAQETLTTILSAAVRQADIQKMTIDELIERQKTATQSAGHRGRTVAVRARRPSRRRRVCEAADIPHIKPA